MSRLPWLSPCRTRMIRLGSRRTHCGWCCRVISQKPHSLMPAASNNGSCWPAATRRAGSGDDDMAGAGGCVYIMEVARRRGWVMGNLWWGSRPAHQLEVPRFSALTLRCKDATNGIRFLIAVRYYQHRCCLVYYILVLQRKNIFMACAVLVGACDRSSQCKSVVCVCRLEGKTVCARG
jgi:hypothetical protein